MKLAPDELIFFDAASEAFFRDQDKKDRVAKPGRDPLAFGLDEIVNLVTPVALAVSAAVMSELTKRTATAVVNRGKRGVGWLRGKVKKAEPALSEAAPVALAPQELNRIKDVARDKARALGLPDAQVELFVDALIGSLVLTDDQGLERA